MILTEACCVMNDFKKDGIITNRQFRSIFVTGGVGFMGLATFD